MAQVRGEAPPSDGLDGAVHAVQVGDGWIVAFNDGEFGASVWWFAANGNQKALNVTRVQRFVPRGHNSHLGFSHTSAFPTASVTRTCPAVDPRMRRPLSPTNMVVVIAAVSAAPQALPNKANETEDQAPVMAKDLPEIVHGKLQGLHVLEGSYGRRTRCPRQQADLAQEFSWA